jgi:hypothetical protein
MIQDETQLKVSQRWLGEFSAALQHLLASQTSMHPRLFAGRKLALERQVQTLEAEIADYERGAISSEG